MRLIFLTFIFIASTNIFLITTFSQENTFIGARIERKLKSEEPRWRFKSMGTGGKAIKQVWEYKKERVTVTINEMESADEAAETVQAMTKSVAMGNVVELQSVGDKAYLVKPSKQVIERDGYAGLVFIQENVLVNLRANSETTVKRFASHIVGEIKAHNLEKKGRVN